VERKVERGRRRGEEVVERLGNCDRLLPAVRERRDRHHAAMEFADVLRRRKMVRSYTDAPVDREAVERIVARGRKAPSGGFSQGVRMVVVTEEATRGRIAEFANEAYYVERGLEPWISRAPVHIVVAMREDD